jgi:hypothetical protein
MLGDYEMPYLRQILPPMLVSKKRIQELQQVDLEPISSDPNGTQEAAQ